MSYSQTNFYKKILGGQGEKVAARFLKKKGFKIIEKNYTTRFGEIDLIGLYGDFLVFIEVKTRTNTAFGDPCEAVDLRKIEHYRICAQQYMLAHRDITLQPRFDVVEILDGVINHIEDAF